MSKNLESTSLRDLLCASLRESDVGTTVTRLRVGRQAARAR